MTRVLAGTIPDFRATLRASVPLLNVFLPVFLICPAHKRTSYYGCVLCCALRKLLPDDSTIPEPM